MSAQDCKYRGQLEQAYISFYKGAPPPVTQLGFMNRLISFQQTFQRSMCIYQTSAQTLKQKNK